MVASIECDKNNMGKVTFVYPDFEGFGIECLMSVCVANDIDVELVYYEAQDAYLGTKKSKINYSSIANRIISTNPDIVAFSCVTDNFQYQLKCARALKAVKPDILTIFGGVHITATSERVIKHPEVDSIAIGESEISLIDFIKSCQREKKFTFPDKPVKGIVYKKHDRTIGEFIEGELPNLDSLPIPLKSHFAKVAKDNGYEYRLLTSRGCPYKCAYCFNSHMNKLRGNSIVRQRSVNKIIEELLAAKKNFRPGFINILDDCFTINEQWLLDFCNQYKQQIDLPYACVTSPFHLNEKKIKALSESKCVYVQIGIQSLSEDLCANTLSRPSQNSKIFGTIQLLKNYGISVQVDHMLGIPGDSILEQEKAILHYCKYRPDVISVFWLTYYPKTSIIKTLEAKNLINEEDKLRIEDGLSLTGNTTFTGGSVRDADAKPYHCISFMLNWLPVLPSFLVRFMMFTKLYRLFSIKNYILSVAIPRFIKGMLNPNDVRAKSHIKRFFSKQ